MVFFFKWYKSREVAEELPEIYRGHSEEELTLEFKRRYQGEGFC
jgi:hypothetical protein